MCHNRRLYLIILCLVILFCLTGCTYNPPEGYTETHHTYEELVEYAKSIDPNATVENTPVDEKEDSREYRVYPAKIKGFDCYVASISQSVYNEGVFAGEFAKKYYRMDTDFDYRMIRASLSLYPELGTIDNESLTLRFQPRDVITSVTSVDEMNREIFDFLFDLYIQMDQENEMYPLHKKHRLKLETGGKRYYFTEPTQEEREKVRQQMIEDGNLN